MNEIKNNIEVVIGLEIHAQVNVKTKMFCSCNSNSFKLRPNSNVCGVCMGFPGQIPVLNNEALKKAIVAGMALNCSISLNCRFDRKNYFYPDLPKGFQITQNETPIAFDGFITIENESGDKSIGISRLHLEDDAGKLTHEDDGSLCDFNRSGISLMEIVSNPDMRSYKEAVNYAKKIQTILRYTDSSLADMEKGMMRFDASVSVREKGSDSLNHRAEIKNLNSFKALELAIIYESDRQIKLFSEGKVLENDVTLGFDEDTKSTYFLRDKESADDYKYCVEPDIPSLEFDKDFIDSLKALVPEMPEDKVKRYVNDFGLSLDDAKIICNDKFLADFFEQVSEGISDYKLASSFILSVVVGYLNKNSLPLKDSNVDVKFLIELLNMVKNGKISLTQARNDIFDDMLSTGLSPVDIVKKKGLEQVSNVDDLEKVCLEVISENSSVVDDYKSGKKQAFGYLVGQVMKKMQGRANPKIVNDILNKLIIL